MSKERVIEILNDIVELALSSKGIDDDPEYMNEIIEAEEYLRECARNFTPNTTKGKTNPVEWIETGTEQEWHN